MQLLYKSVQEPIDVLAEKMQKSTKGLQCQHFILFNDEIGSLKANSTVCRTAKEEKK
jgi:hypothetical protein